MKIIGLFVLCISMFSTLLAKDFEKNVELVETLKKNNVRLVVLCNFQGTNNVLDIVTSSRSPGYDLTNYGLATLEDTAPIFAGLNIDHIYTAPAFRAQQSTNLLGKKLGLVPNQLSIDARLGMQNFGSGEGEDYDVYKTRFTSQQDMFEDTPENGEPGISVFTRAEAFLMSLNTLQNQTVLIITHAFNYCHISKCLTGKYGMIPAPGTYIIYDFSESIARHERAPIERDRVCPFTLCKSRSTWKKVQLTDSHFSGKEKENRRNSLLCMGRVKPKS